MLCTILNNNRGVPTLSEGDPSTRVSGRERFEALKLNTKIGLTVKRLVLENRLNKVFTFVQSFQLQAALIHSARKELAKAIEMNREHSVRVEFLHRVDDLISLFDDQEGTLPGEDKLVCSWK